MTKRKYNVLFLCTGNSARSILAECILNREGRGRFQAFSAGSAPKGQVHPGAIAQLQKLNYQTNQLRSKSWDEFALPNAPKLDVVITVCDNAANEVCPVWPGHPISAHWGIADPAAIEGDQKVQEQAFAEAYQHLNNRISALINIPGKDLNALALQQIHAELEAR